MKPLVIAGFILLAGCDPAPEISINTGHWACSKVADVPSILPIIAGKAVMVIPKTEKQCVQWTRMGYDP
ncbi:hypothetical protein [Pseudomonas putida]|uniref:hypothetical protein n=1 Tax=Pseudomonas putida TaxID=303 RepID=UPI00117A11FB|nr:hypothetical protein [Pseudomonas putida]